MFVTAKGQDLLTFSRSTTGTYIGSDGLLKTAAVDEARIEYDGSGNVQGLLLEPISTNQWTNSTTFSGQWGHGGILTGGQSPDPAGGNSAYLWTDVDSAYDQDMLNALKSGITASGDNRWTASMFVKKPLSAPAGTEFEHWNFLTGGTGSSLNTRWEFDSNGDISLTAKSASLFNVGYDTLANGWYRIYQTFFDASGNNTNVYQRIYAGRRAAGYTGSLLVYGPQLEQNHMVTSYIPTTGVEGTRQPDIAYIDIDQFGVKQDRGTFVAEINNLKWFTNSPSSSFPRVIEFGNTTDNSDRLVPILVRTDNNVVYLAAVTDNSSWGYTQWEDYADSADVGPFSGKIAYRYDETSARAAKDGTILGSEDTDTNIEGQSPYRTRLGIRRQSQAIDTNGGDPVKLHLKSLKYYPRKISDIDMFSETDNTIQNGLTFNLDATAYTNYSTSNLLSPYPWTVGTGSETFYAQNGSTSENERVVDTNPFGDTDIVWQSPSNDATSDADGGWNTNFFNVDTSKTYRFSVWTRKKDVQGNGRFYLGSNGYNSSGVNIGILNRLAGETNTNFYFTAPRFDDGSISPSVSVGDWVLVVGHIWPEGSGTGIIHPDSGIYEADGTKKTSYPGQKDGVWQTGTTQSIHRSYQYYSTTTNEKHQWWAPRVDVLDGNEPTISELINGAGRNWELTSQSSVGLNGSYWDDDTSGTFVFDGTNDYISTNRNTITQNATYSFWANRTQSNNTYNMMAGIYLPYFSFRNDNRIFFSMSINGQKNLVTTSTFSDNTWYKFDFVHDYDGVNTTALIYVNGELEASATYAGAQSTPTNRTFMLGGWRSDDPTNYPFEGKISQAQIYNRALTATEIQKNYNFSKARYGL